MEKHPLDPKTLGRIQAWLDGPFDAETKAKIQRRLQDDPQSLSDAFFQDLSFGTGGMRGIMGIGTNRMNLYTVRRAVEGLARYILRTAPKPHRVFIGYDVRHNSALFAREAAQVLGAHGIEVYLTREVSSTPLVSFGCRHFQCTAGIMITASHNPPEYNGLKIYWSDGCQVLPPHDTGIMEEVKKAELPPPHSQESNIHWVGAEFETIYFQEILKLQLIPAKPLEILYSNLHGTGIRYVPKALKDRGFTSLSLIEKQASLDGNFPFAHSPNPEDPKALALGTEELLCKKSDLFLATDPDADRVGCVVLHQNQAIALTGNQIAALLTHHIATQKTLPPNGAFVKTIVTTELIASIAHHHHMACIDTLTGFKYIGELITKWETTREHTYLFGGEESYGTLFGTYARDKDAISAACLIAEAASLAKEQNLTLIDRLHELYRTYGLFREKLLNLSFGESRAGQEKMQHLMAAYRKEPPLQKVIRIEDYKTRRTLDLRTRKETPLTLPKSDVLRFFLEDGTKIVIRPSGTEPKVKIYLEVMAHYKGDLEGEIRELDARLEGLAQHFLPKS